MSVMLSEREAVDHVISRGLAPRGESLVPSRLAGGVSNDAIAVQGRGAQLVVKRPLPALRVAQKWCASERRVANEARALRLAATITPGRVPGVLDLDLSTHTLVLEHAPAGWVNWRDELLAGRAEACVGAQLGEALRMWHRETAAMAPALEPFGDLEPFVQLRIEPFFRTVIARHPGMTDQLEAVVTRLLSARRCLVHGDFSPKNVLVGDGRVWVIDWEVAHAGDPAFDVAFLLSHLLLKSHHRRSDAPAYRAVARSFLNAYGDCSADNVIATLGCLLIARVDGKSPAIYLSADAAVAVRSLGTALLLDAPSQPLDAWEHTPCMR